MGACMPTCTFSSTLDLARLWRLETSASRARGVFGQRRLQVHQHDVVATGLELHRFACGQVKAIGQRGHLHDVFFHFHFVDFHHASRRAAGRHQLGVVFGRDLHERARGLLALHRGACPCVGDGHVLCKRANGAHAGESGGDEVF